LLMCSTANVYGCFYFSENPRSTTIPSQNSLFQQREIMKVKLLLLPFQIEAMCNGVGGGDTFLMCFLEGPNSQPTRLAYISCWRKIVRIPLKRANQQERNVFIAP